MSSSFRPGPNPNTVIDESGAVLKVPAGWVLLPPGDAALTRRVKAAGECWSVAEKRGRKVFSQGIYAPAATIEHIRKTLDVERADPAFQRKKEADAKRREVKQNEYIEDFLGSVRSFLAFHTAYAPLEKKIAIIVTEHATPVGSGTVARTERIPIEQRAEAAVIAWMRHKTTAYDNMAIKRIKGERRNVRRMLAKRSHELLDHYRRGGPQIPDCPLMKAIKQHQLELEQTAK